MPTRQQYQKKSTKETEWTTDQQKAQRARTNWNNLRENLAGVIEKMKNITETEAKNTPANARNSRATDKGKKPDYKQKRSYIKKTTRAEKLYHPKRRECTTQAAKNGMELQKWMQTVGEGNTELRKPKGIG